MMFLKNYQAEKDRIVEFFLQGAILTPLNVRKPRMAAKAMQDIFSGIDWITAEQLGAKGITVGCTDSGFKTGANRANRWKAEGKIFAIQRSGRDWYPRYQFDDDYTPIPAMKEVVARFDNDYAIEIAAWMESPNNYLGGKRPREVVSHDRAALQSALEMHFPNPASTKSAFGS